MLVFDVGGASLWNNVLVGAVILLAAGYNVYRLSNDIPLSVGVSTLVAVLGIWLIVSAALLGMLGSLFWSTLAAGLLVTGLSGYNAYEAWRPGRSQPNRIRDPKSPPRLPSPIPSSCSLWVRPRFDVGVGFDRRLETSEANFGGVVAGCDDGKPDHNRGEPDCNGGRNAVYVAVDHLSDRETDRTENEQAALDWCDTKQFCERTFLEWTFEIVSYAY